MSKTSRTVEFYDENTNESVCVDIDFDVSVEETEYEGPYVFYQGGVFMEGYELEPFTFKGKAYKDFEPELLPYLDTYTYQKDAFKDVIAVLVDDTLTEEDRGDIDVEAQACWERFVQDAFDRHIVPGFEVPVRRYPMNY